MSLRRRNSNRLQGYDYSLAGAYFLTLVTKGRDPLFGQVKGEVVELNAIGKIVAEEWIRTQELRQNVELDEFVVMPDHFHAILFINETLSQTSPSGAHRGAPLRRQHGSLGAIVAGFKSKCSQRTGETLWQRNYFDRIIRDEEELNRIRDYIRYNPLLLSEKGEGLWK